MNQFFICLVLVILLLNTKGCFAQHTILIPSEISFLKGLSGYISDKANVVWFNQDEKNRKKYGSLINPEYKKSLITDITMYKISENVYQFGIGFNTKINGIKKITITDVITHESFNLYTKEANTSECGSFSTKNETAFLWCNIYSNKNFFPFINGREYIISFTPFNI